MSIEDYSVEDLERGYYINEQMIGCLFCEVVYEQGEVFPIHDRLYGTEKAMKHHMTTVHGSAFEALLQLDKKHTGLTDVQSEMLQLFYEGLSDKEIVESSLANSLSTIRQHRFKLKEKEKQAKIFVALMRNLETKKTNQVQYKGETTMDKKYGITPEETEKVLTTYFKDGLDGGIETFPSKEKRKVIIMQHIIKRFQDAKAYTEKEVNEILKQAYYDYVTLRRYFIEYGFMDRSKDGSSYWVKGTRSEA